MMNYILIGHEAVAEPDVMKWAEWFESADRTVARTETDDVQVSTVFLATDHSFGDPPPILFETMVFGGEHDGDQNRCSTWEESQVMHKDMCQQIFK